MKDIDGLLFYAKINYMAFKNKQKEKEYQRKYQKNTARFILNRIKEKEIF